MMSFADDLMARFWSLDNMSSADGWTMCSIKIPNTEERVVLELQASPPLRTLAFGNMPKALRAATAKPPPHPQLSAKAKMPHPPPAQASRAPAPSCS